MNKTDQC